MTVHKKQTFGNGKPKGAEWDQEIRDEIQANATKAKRTVRGQTYEVTVLPSAASVREVKPRTYKQGTRLRSGREGARK